MGDARMAVLAEDEIQRWILGVSIFHIYPLCHVYSTLFDDIPLIILPLHSIGSEAFPVGG